MSMFTEWLPGLRQAWRNLWRSPLFAATALLTLGLGVGANSAVFSILNRVLIHPLPGVRQMDRLVLVDVRAAQHPDWAIGVNPGGFYAYQREMRMAMASGAWRASNDGEIQDGSEPSQTASVLHATWDLLPTLGLEPRVGRGFTREEDAEGAPRVVMLSEGLWKARYAADPAVVGRTLKVGGVDRQIIGVAPNLPSRAFGADQSRGVVVPLALPDLERQQHRGGYLRMIARLAPGATVAQLDQELRGIDARLKGAAVTDGAAFVVHAGDLRDALTADWRSSLTLQSAAMAFILLIACANVANMLLAKGVERQRELAVRVALGASRADLFRQLLLESAVLGFLGGVVGLAFGKVILKLLIACLPPHPALPPSMSLDGWTMGITLALGLGSTLLFGLLPALQASRNPEGSLLNARGATRNRLRDALVVVEMALATAMLLCGGLMIRSISKLEAFRPGFDTRNVLCVQLQSKKTSGASAGPSRQATISAIMGRLRSMPGVECVGQSFMTPAETGGRVNQYWIPGQEDAKAVDASCNTVGPEYFRAYGIRFVEGRTFQPGERLAVIVNQSLAQRHWPGQSALGKTLRTQCPDEGRTEQTPLTVIGVIEDLRLKQPGAPIYALNYFYSEEGQTLSLRVSGSPASYVHGVEQAVAETAPGWRVAKAQPISDRVDLQSRDTRTKGLMLGAYALTALLLASLGIYGVMAFSVELRRREIGIRMGLGAQVSQILALILRRGLWLTLAGLGVGLGMGLALVRMLEDQLFQVARLDPISWVGSATLLLAVGMLACFIPAWRAAQTDPARILKSE